jgi:hypothetical protein
LAMVNEHRDKEYCGMLLPKIAKKYGASKKRRLGLDHPNDAAPKCSIHPSTNQ